MCYTVFMKNSRESVASRYNEIFKIFGLSVRTFKGSKCYVVVDDRQLVLFGGQVVGSAYNVRELEALLNRLAAPRPTHQAGTAR
ncbi:MAG: hypothetical protein [Microvirus sp.]|nr:MAG: hypothetical protein [Microvirus sp.]